MPANPHADVPRPSDATPPGVRARFECVARQKGGGVTLSAVQAISPDHPNHQLWKATPSGKIELYIHNPDAAARFELGREYDVTFSPLPLPTPASASPPTATDPGTPPPPTRDAPTSTSRHDAQAQKRV